jgi:hypothetical protein
MYDVTIFSESPLFTMVHEVLYFDGPTVLQLGFVNEEAWQIRLSKMDNIRSAADFVVTNYADTTRLSLERRHALCRWLAMVAKADKQHHTVLPGILALQLEHLSLLAGVDAP